MRFFCIVSFSTYFFVLCLLVCVPRCVWTLCVVQAASIKNEAAHRPPTLKPPTDKFKCCFHANSFLDQLFDPKKYESITHPLTNSNAVCVPIPIPFLNIFLTLNTVIIWARTFNLNILAFLSVQNIQNSELPLNIQCIP